MPSGWEPGLLLQDPGEGQRPASATTTSASSEARVCVGRPGVLLQGVSGPEEHQGGHIHRAGAPKAPSEKRLAIDLAGGQRQWEMRNPGLEPTSTRPMKVPLHWVPTEWQMCDVLTKRMCPCKCWGLMATGNIKIPSKFNKQQ